MNILVIAPTPFFASRGTHIRILEEALALEKKGHSITIATYHIGSNIPADISNTIDVRRIRRWLFWYKKLEAGPDWQKVLLDIMLFRKVFFLTRTKKPDVLYAHLHEGVLIGWAIQKIFFWRKITLIADFHGGLTSEMSSHGYLKGAILKNMFGFVEKVIDRMGDVAVVSSWENAAFIEKARAEDVQVLPDGVNVSCYRRLPNKKTLRKKWNIPESSVVFIYAGALIPNKGLNRMLEAVQRFQSSGGSAYFVFAGFPLEHIEREMRQYGLKKNTRIISPLRYFDLPDLLQACDVGMDPKGSSVQQASGKILQYMAAGLPVLCFDRENNRKYLADGAYYCKEGSAEALAKGMWRCIREKEHLSKIGAKNRERAKAFSWKKSAEKMHNIICR